MDKMDYKSLVSVRFDRAKELYSEAKELVKMDCYKSANNRAFYAVEKCIKALLATKQMDVETHNGAVSQLIFCLYIRRMPSLLKMITKKLLRLIE